MTYVTMLKKPNLKEIAREFVSQIAECSEEFRACKANYEEALDTLKIELGENAAPTVDQLQNALDTQLAIFILNSWRLGYDANLDHFRNPVNRTFIEVDPEDYLRETMVHNLQHYAKAAATVDQFWRQLNESQRGTFEAVTEFESYTATIIPKLAHYLGYSYANTVLPLTEPGYAQDHVLTSRYKRYLEEMDSIYEALLSETPQ